MSLLDEARYSLEKFLLVLARSIFEKMGFSIYSLKNVKMNLYLKFDVGHARSRMLEKKVLEVSLMTWEESGLICNILIVCCP